MHRCCPARSIGFLTRCRAEDTVDSFLKSLGSCYTTTPEEGGYRGWLAEISRRVAAATGQTNSN